MTRTTMAREARARPAIAFDLHSLNHLSGFYLAYLKTEQIVDICIDQRPCTIDGKRPHVAAEGPDGLDDGVGLRIGNGHRFRTQTCKKRFRTLQTHDRVV